VRFPPGCARLGTGPRNHAITRSAHIPTPALCGERSHCGRGRATRASVR
jgi:hypothetical protein